MRQQIVKTVIWLITFFALSASTGASAQSIPKAEVEQALALVMDQQRRAPGMVIGITDEAGRRTFARGVARAGSDTPVGADSVFEIGSVSKVFTSLLLVEMARRGELKIEDPVAAHLPQDVTLPERQGRQIRLVDLSTHTSGLPRDGCSGKVRPAHNPLAEVTLDEFFAAVGACQLQSDVGDTYAYSNAGAALLGAALAHRAGKSYQALLRERIALPLRMALTGVELTPEMRALLATGHDRAHTPVSNWDIPAFPGAGGIRSSVNDLLNFLEAQLERQASPLAPAMKIQAHSVRKPTGAPQSEIALGWQITRRPDRTLVQHGGGTGGYVSFVGFDPERRVGVVVLANVGSVGVVDVGLHLLDPSIPIRARETPSAPAAR